MISPAMALLALAPAACLPVATSEIRARDVARAWPAFESLPPDLVLGYALAGERCFSPAELARLARRYGLDVAPGAGVCFVRRLETLAAERVAAALRAALPAARIELLDFSRQPVPSGDLEFPLAGLPVESPHAPSLLWWGRVRVPGRADFPVWARARITVSGTRVRTAVNLEAGRSIESRQLIAEDYEGPPGFPDIAEVAGRSLRRALRAGALIERQWLRPADEVLPGDPVRLEVRCGRARLFLDATAASAGLQGETVTVRNPGNGKLLRGAVVGRGRVLLAAPFAPWGKP